jgi:NADPH2:quinone reductase
MKAAVCRELGPPQVVRIEDMPTPQAGPGQVRIKVAAASLNFPDVLMVAGGYQMKPPLPFIVGLECAGTVDQCGDGVTGVAIGDRVMVRVRPGAFAEYVLADAGTVVPTPDRFSDAEAAAFVVAYGTAWHCLLDRGGLQPGEVALIHGASGGVGLAAVELAKRKGARVIATGGSDDKLAVATRYGADHVINYRTGGFRDRVNELTDGRGADVIYDPVGGDVFDQSLRCVAWRGRIVIVGFADGRIPEIPANYPLLKGCAVIGARAGEFRRREPEAGHAMEAELLRMAGAGELNPHISHTLPLDQVVEAMELIRRREVVGKAVLTVG